MRDPFDRLSRSDATRPAGMSGQSKAHALTVRVTPVDVDLSVSGGHTICPPNVLADERWPAVVNRHVLAARATFG